MQKIKSILNYFFVIIFSILTAVSLTLFPFLVGSEDISTSLIGYFYLLIFLVSSTILFFTLRIVLQKNISSPMKGA